MRRVFISYSRQNLDAVTQLVDDLHAVGIEPWHDQTLTGGQRWWDKILANIRECDVFIFALSPESWDSEACKSELGYVVRLGRPILPVLVSEGININLLPPPLNEIQVMDYRRRDKDATLALVKAIHTTPEAPPLPEPLPNPPPVPVSYLSTLKERIDSPEPLSSEAQITLLFELEEELREGRSPAEVRDLLLRLKKRDELLARIASKIDAALNSIQDKSMTHRPKNAVSAYDAPAAHQDKQPTNFQSPAQTRLCTQCRTQSEPGASFCRTCGAKVPVVSEEKVERSESRRYLCPPEDTARLVADVKSWLDSQEFDSQQMSAEGQNLLIQIKKRGGWRDYVGMATTLNILFKQSEDTLTVEIGAGKWMDKAAGGAVGMFILWPLAITAGFGAWEQMKMPEKIFDFIGARLRYK